MMTRVSYTHVLRYVNWLEGEGFVERIGRNEKNGVIYRNTEPARRTPETPYPPLKIVADPFAKERVAAATITRLMLCSDPYAQRTGRMISEACKILLARFDKNNAEVPRNGDAASLSQQSWQGLRSRTENENEEEQSHVE